MSSSGPGGRGAVGLLVPAAVIVAIAVVGTWVLTSDPGDAPPSGVETRSGQDRQASSEGEEATGQVAQERDIVFVHAPDDGIHVLDGDDGTLIRALARGEGGFLRGALRPLEAERRRFDADPTASYRLMRYSSGQLVLFDPHTDLRLNVDAFGSSSREEFLTLLPPP